ncbi:MAG: protease inhibitor I42 family protein [Anaerolineaceae bacterium]|nr:protease inhibitor I42 family protein [Anaerolineaceae bacterium]
MRKIWQILLITILAAVALSACGNGTVVAGEDMSGSEVSVKKGENVEVKLTGNASTGYSWVVQEVDGTILQSNGDPAYKADSNLTGAGGTYTYSFKALETGTTTLKMAYLRTFEKDVAPLRTFELTVTVTDK